MKVFSIFLIVVATALAGDASSLHGFSGRRHHLGHRDGLGKKEIVRRCEHRSRTVKSKPEGQASLKGDPDAHLSKSHEQPSRPDKDGPCGSRGATDKTTATAGPNGSIDWFNCGLNYEGWTPPFLAIGDVISHDLSTVVNEDNSPFKACSKFTGLFNKHAEQNSLPAILLASIALQESSCNPAATGDGGEQGLMQISKDKCGGAPEGDCKNPDYNIEQGAQFLASTLKKNNGSVLETLGSYNGWQPKMTYRQATAAASSSCCRCQNNLDYQHQVLNGLMQGIDPTNPQHRLGKFFNLDKCK